MPSPILVDTHAVVWYLSDSKKLSTKAHAAIDEALIENVPVYVSAITLVELVYLVEKGRVQAEVLEDLRKLLLDTDTSLQITPVDAEVSEALEVIPRDEVPDMPDRVIAATALARKVSLVTVDDNIRKSSSPIQVIW